MVGCLRLSLGMGFSEDLPTVAISWLRVAWQSPGWGQGEPWHPSGFSASFARTRKHLPPPQHSLSLCDHNASRLHVCV